MLNERNIPLEEDGIEEEILVEDELTITKAMWGDIGGNIENQTDLQNALDAKQDSLTEAQLNAVNSGITAEKVTTYDGYADQIASKANQSALNAEATTREQADTALGRRIDDEATARQQADNGLQSQIDAITSQSDVVDVVANYAALQAYDTSSLSDNDVIKVLDDETHEDALTYYRWSTATQTWTYIGQEAPYYSKGQMDVMLQGKQDKLTAGANIQIQNGTISATDTTYTAGNGLNLNGTEFSADTTVLATKSDLDSYYTKTETDTKLAPKLETEVVSTLPATGSEGKLYLTPKAHTTQTATGNPITATVAEEAGAIESLKLDGDTYQQTYSGKNLSPNIGSLIWSSNNITNRVIVDDEMTFTLSTTANFSGVYLNKTTNYDICKYYYESGYIVSFEISASEQTDFTVGQSGGAQTRYTVGTTPVRISATTNDANLIIYATDKNGASVSIKNIQVESGSTATSFEPYVGGAPSPNPDYPQAIQTVTGLQTVSINGTDYPLDLGNIELNGLGDDGNGNPLYKDRIYKDGEDWKVHKVTGKYTFTGSEDGWLKSGASTSSMLVGAIAVQPLGILVPTSVATTLPKSNYFTLDSTQGIGIFWLFSQSGGYSQYVRFGIAGTSSSTVDDFKNWLSSHNTDMYYPTTATDTAITDQTLIAQLEAIRTAALENGANTITNTATGSNLAGDMEISYYGYNPTNRYDKFIWLDLNNNYEQIGS